MVVVGQKFAARRTKKDCQIKLMIRVWLSLRISRFTRSDMIYYSSQLISYCFMILHTFNCLFSKELLIDGTVQLQLH